MPGSNETNIVIEIFEELIKGFTIYDEYLVKLKSDNFTERDNDLKNEAEGLCASASLKFKYYSSSVKWSARKNWAILRLDLSSPITIYHNTARHLLECTIDTLDQASLKKLKKKTLFYAIKQSSGAVEFLKRCVSADKNDPLRQRFWEKEKFGKACTIHNGKRKEICDYLKHKDPDFNPEAEYYNQCLERLALAISVGSTKTHSLTADFAQTVSNFIIHAKQGSKNAEDYKHDDLTRLLKSFGGFNVVVPNQTALLQAISVLPRKEQISFLRDCADPAASSELSRYMRKDKRIVETVTARLQAFSKLSAVEEKAEISSLLQKTRGYNKTKMKEILDLILQGIDLYDKYMNNNEKHFYDIKELEKQAFHLWQRMFVELEVFYRGHESSAPPKEKHKWSILVNHVERIKPPILDRSISGAEAATSFRQVLLALELILTNLTDNDALANDEIIKIDKEKLFSAIKKLPTNKQIPLLKLCVAYRNPLHFIFWDRADCLINNGTRKKICDHLKLIEPGFNPEAEYYNQYLESLAHRLVLNYPMLSDVKKWYEEFNKVMENFIRAVTSLQMNGCKNEKDYEHNNLEKYLPTIVRTSYVQYLDQETIFSIIKLLPPSTQIDLLTPDKPENIKLFAHFKNAKNGKMVEKIAAQLATLQPKQLGQTEQAEQGAEEKGDPSKTGTSSTNDDTTHAVRFKFATDPNSKPPKQQRPVYEVDEYELQPLTQRNEALNLTPLKSPLE